jgi:uncharacterized membrane protein YphA (DoxX/SURF4 family)
MNTIINKVQKISPAFLRIGMALVFIWFGYSQLTDPTSWLDFIPQSVISISGMTANTLVFLNGIFEVVFGVSLLLGFFTRFVALILALHLIDITYIVGFDSIGVRDFGLSVAILAVWMNGADWLTLDNFVKGEQVN